VEDIPAVFFMVASTVIIVGVCCARQGVLCMYHRNTVELECMLEAMISTSNSSRPYKEA
jgi:hypothetical protein